MGLFYQFPSRLDGDDDRIAINDDTLVLKTYGPPGIFWIYLLAIFSTLFFLYLVSHNLLVTMLKSDDPINRMLAIGVGVVMVGVFVALVGIFFYEKNIYKRGRDLKIVHRIFAIPCKRSSHKLMSAEAFKIKHCLDSPNIARREQWKGSRGFQNNGFFLLEGVLEEDSSFMVDRHSQIRELERLKTLLSRY